ncbi:acyl carrier protein [Nocardia sp. NPDC006044]|uniref:acyl carrier protein n=1 Tax=Nocardia sp. NPDC006044 TaxID=3364306 RepID=UPI00368BFCB4
MTSDSDTATVARRVRMVLGSVLQVAEADLPDEPATHNLRRWDSLHHMMLMLALEGEFGLRIEPEATPSLTSAAAIEAHINGRAG